MFTILTMVIARCNMNEDWVPPVVICSFVIGLCGMAFMVFGVCEIVAPLTSVMGI